MASQQIQLSHKDIGIFAEYRERWMNSWYLFAKECLGYNDISEEVHGEVSDKIIENDECLILLPRGHLKTSYVTIGYSIWKVCHNRNIRIYITNALLDVSKKFMREIKGHMEENVMLKTLWPEVFYHDPEKESKKWSETEIIVKRGVNKKEATITVGSVGKLETGSHYDIHLYDDIVNDENTSTPEQIEKVWDWYRLSLSLLEPGGRSYILGTRYDYSDPYQRLLDSGIPQITRKAIENDKPILPSLFTKERLEKIKKKQGSFIFSCQYENEPIDQESAPFKKKFRRYWDVLPDKLNKYMLVDLAISQRDTACETALEIVGFSEKGEIYCVEDCAGIFTPSETVEHMYRLHEKWDHPIIGVEKQQLEKALYFWLLEAAKKHGYILPYHELKPDMDKIRRIRSSLQPFWEQGRLFLKPDMLDLETQFLKFPRYNKRDRIDAIAYIIQLATRPRRHVKIETFKADYGSIFEKISDKITRVMKQKRKPKEELSWMTL